MFYHELEPTFFACLFKIPRLEDYVSAYHSQWRALNGRTVNALFCWPTVPGSSPSLGKTPTLKTAIQSGSSVTCMKSLVVP